MKEGQINMTKEKAWMGIIGNEHIKRALIVAMAGGHTMGVIGTSRNGKRELQAILGKKVIVSASCPCGGLGEAQGYCTCTPAKIRKFRTTGKYRRLQFQDIIVNVVTPRWGDYERASKGLSFKEALAEAKIETTGLSLAIHPDALYLLKSWVERYFPVMEAVNSAKRVAETIAQLAKDNEVKAHHMAEALQYKMPM